VTEDDGIQTDAAPTLHRELNPERWAADHVANLLDKLDARFDNPTRSKRGE
jgi:hypothetical protein